jgi:Txe/YoeB family toxin of Txe-Axe toxin-antitoxin module
MSQNEPKMPIPVLYDVQQKYTFKTNFHQLVSTKLKINQIIGRYIYSECYSSKQKKNKVKEIYSECYSSKQKKNKVKEFLINYAFFVSDSVCIIIYVNHLFDYSI